MEKNRSMSLYTFFILIIILVNDCYIRNELILKADKIKFSEKSAFKYEKRMKTENCNERKFMDIETKQSSALNDSFRESKKTELKKVEIFEGENCGYVHYEIPDSN